ncbi:Sec63 Brl domain-containing protein, partial [Filobasidium floriforme]
NYDESGALASYFAISFLSLILFPTTLIILRRAVVGTKGKGKECECESCQRKVKYMKRFATEGSGLNLLLLAGWTAFFALAYIISQSEGTETKVYDPFEILGLSSANRPPILQSSDEKAIKKHFKKISLKYHPDKIKASDNQTKEEAETYFVELTKAYKSLTDEAIRDNLRKFGNPDGQQPREDKIAIPSWVVEGNNGLWVLALYGIGLGGGIPFVVGRWWFKQRVLTKDGALSSTAELFFHNLIEDISFPALLALIASALEIKTILAAKSSSKKQKRTRQTQTEALEKKVRTEAERLGMGDVLAAGWESEKGKGVVLPNPHNRRAVALLWTHLLRIEDIEAELLDERREILLQVPKFIPSLVNVSVAYHWLNTTTMCMNLYAQLVQAVPSLDYPALQLPGIDIEQAKVLMEKGISGQGWQKKVVGDAEVEKLIGDEGIRIAKEFPQLHVSDAKFEVEGENSITVGSLCQFVYTVHLTAEEPSPQALKASQKNQKVEDKDDKDVVFAHAPCWPGHRKPHWWVMVADGTSNTVLFPPQRIGDIPLVTSDEKDVSAEKSAKGKTFKLTFPAPPTPGSTSLEVYFISDTFIGGNLERSVVLTVANEEAAPPPQADDGDISDPDEDTLAGQIAMMKGQRVKKADEQDDEDEEGSSDEEGDGGRGTDDSSDSDSEDETPRGKKVVDSSDSDSD